MNKKLLKQEFKTRLLKEAKEIANIFASGILTMKGKRNSF